jgi:hypothetical protein
MVEAWLPLFTRVPVAGIRGGAYVNCGIYVAPLPGLSWQAGTVPARRELSWRAGAAPARQELS